MKIEIIASCYGYKEGDMPSLPGHIARMLILKGKAIVVICFQIVSLT